MALQFPEYTGLENTVRIERGKAHKENASQVENSPSGLVEP